MKEICAKWNLKVATIEPISSFSGRTWFVETLDSGCFVLKNKSGIARSEQERKLLLALSKTGIPLPLPRATVDGAWYAPGPGGQVYCLYRRLPGRVIAEHYAGDAETRARAFGKAIGLLHQCFQQCDNAGDFKEMALTAQIQEWAIPCIRESEHTVAADAIERIWQEIEPEFVSLYAKLPRHLIHRDAHTSNVLFEGTELTGWLDFEIVRRGPRVFDVCYCASSMLVEGFDDPAQGQRWPSLFRALLRGYEEFYPLTAPERRAVYGVFVSTTLLFIAFFLDQGLEDAARRNESLLYWLATRRNVLAT